MRAIVGGDGYGMFTGSTTSVSREKMAEVLREHIVTDVQPTP